MVCSSRVMVLPNTAEPLPICCLREEEMESYSTYTCPIIDTSGHYLWKAIAAQASNRGTLNMGLKCEEFVASIEGPTYFWQSICAVLVCPIKPVIRISVAYSIYR